MKSNHLISLLHLCDPTLPIGAFSHSFGLESYVQLGVVKDKKTALTYIYNSLHFNIKFNDGIYLVLAYKEAASDNIDNFVNYDIECSALKSPQECREASIKLGNRLLKIFSRQANFESSREGQQSGNWAIIREVAQLVEQKKIDGHFATIYGAVAFALGIGLSDSLLSFYFNSLVGMVTNCNKLIPLGQIDGQDILFELEKTLEELTQETIELDISYRGACAAAFDIRAMEHERLYSRLYMS